MEYDPTVDLIERLNSVRVKSDELERVLCESEKRHKQGEAGDENEGMLLTVTMFPRKPQKAQAVYFRLLALARLLEQEQPAGWSMPCRKDGAILTKRELISAAAVCPLVKVDADHVGFERESLLAKALELTEPEGTC